MGIHFAQPLTAQNTKVFTTMPTLQPKCLHNNSHHNNLSPDPTEYSPAHCLHVYTRATTEHGKHRTQKEKDHSPIGAAELSWRKESEKTKKEKKEPNTHEGVGIKPSQHQHHHRSPCIPHTPHYHPQPCPPVPTSVVITSAPPPHCPHSGCHQFDCLPLPSDVRILLSPLVGSLLIVLIVHWFPSTLVRELLVLLIAC